MKNACLLIAFTIFITFNVTTKAHSEQSYYVRANGSDSNTGYSEKFPFRTLSKALREASEGSIKKIIVIGILNNTSERSYDQSSVFFIRNTGDSLITITGKPDVGDDERAVLSAGGTAKRVVLIGDETNLCFEHIIISDGNCDEGGGGIAIQGGNSHLILGPGVEVTNNISEWIGGGVILFEECDLIINGADITNNTAEAGGGLCIAGNLTLNGGRIAGNKSNSAGGVLVFEEGSFVMNSGFISGNIAVTNAGGIGSAGTLLIYNGEISNNQANENFGGVCIYNTGIFRMYDGKISGNQAMGIGGVVVSGVFFMEGGEITGNISNSSVGGVAVNGGTVVMTGGRISANQTRLDGGGVFVYQNSIFSMSGGEITANQASYGGGIVVDIEGSFTMEGGKIYDNFAYENENVHILEGGIFTYQDGLIMNTESGNNQNG